MSEVDYTRDVCDECEAVIKVGTEHECNVPEALLGYDWRETFSYSNGAWLKGGPARGDKPDQPFAREDVAEVLGADDGCNDGPSWIALVKLKSGMFGFVEASCDYTGWDCQAGGHSYVSDDVSDLVTWAMSNEDRERLKETLVNIGYVAPETPSIGEERAKP